MRNAASLIFAAGLAFLLGVLALELSLGASPMLVGQGIVNAAADETGAANFVTSVVLGYRGIDTLGELSILFATAAGAGLLLGRRRANAARDPEGGFILRAGADFLFPLLLVVGFYIVFHGHLTPGGGFQGGVILAAAFFLPILARPSASLDHGVISLLEGLAGGAFIVIGLWALFTRGDFLAPMLAKGSLGALFSAGTLPLLYLAVGLKVGAELAGLLATLSETEAND
ncbi:MAG: MnhB domain-containing protein [Pseudomonadota bacterium]|nr:MnhB domain-containing protein [Pseudomonadota bacterium]